MPNETRAEKFSRILSRLMDRLDPPPPLTNRRVFGTPDFEYGTDSAHPPFFGVRFTVRGKNYGRHWLLAEPIKFLREPATRHFQQFIADVLADESIPHE